MTGAAPFVSTSSPYHFHIIFMCFLHSVSVWPFVSLSRHLHVTSTWIESFLESVSPESVKSQINSRLSFTHISICAI